MSYTTDHSIRTNCQKIEFSGEAEIYWPEALENGLITRYSRWAQSIMLVNYGTVPVTVCPWYRGNNVIAGVDPEFAEEFVGITLFPNGSRTFDNQSNRIVIDRIRAIAHGWDAILGLEAI